MAVGKKISYIETVVRNLQDSERFYGFLPPHGKRLAAYGDADDEDYFTFRGALETFIARRKRYIDSYNDALDAGLVRVTENKRVVYYATVDDSQAFTAGDLCWWDAVNNVAKPATEFPWSGNLLDTQADFRDYCLGVALESKEADDGTVVLRIDTSDMSYHDFIIEAGVALYIDSAFAPAKDTGNSLLADTITPVDASIACMRLAADATDTDDEVLVFVDCAFNPGELAQGPQGAQSP